MAISQIPIFIKTSVTINTGKVRNAEIYGIYEGKHQEDYGARRAGIESTWGSEVDTTKYYPIYVHGKHDPPYTGSYEVVDGTIPSLVCDTRDDYFFIHRKLQSAFKWFVAECTASHAIVVDDDTFVNWKTLHNISSFGSNDVIGCPWGNPLDMANENWLKEKEEAFGLNVGTLMRDVDPLVRCPQGGAGIILTANSVSLLADNLYFEQPGWDEPQIASVIAKYVPSWTFANWSSIMIPYPLSVYGAGSETHTEYAENRPLSFLTLHDMKDSAMWTTVYNRLKAE